MMVLRIHTEGEDIPNAAIKQPCHASFLRVASKHSVRTFQIRPAHVQTLGGMGERDLACRWVTLQRQRQQPSQPEARYIYSAPNGDDMPRGDSSLFLWHVNPESLLESVGLNIISASGMSGTSSQSLPR